MGPFSMVVMIILIVVIGKVMRERYRAMERLGRHQVDSADTMMMRDEMRQMKERIAVLERVITDNHGSLDLDREIERLRDR